MREGAKVYLMDHTDGCIAASSSRLKGCLQCAYPLADGIIEIRTYVCLYVCTDAYLYGCRGVV